MLESRLVEKAILAFDIETTGLDPKYAKITVVRTEDIFTGEKTAYEYARVEAEISDLQQQIREKHACADLEDLRISLEVAQEELCKMTENLIKQFDSASSLCAFNGIRFDIPFMHTALDLPVEITTSWVLKTTDILECSRLLHGKTFKLDLLCEYNGLPMKSASGLAAIAMAKEGRFSELRDYCADDVSILCNLYHKRHIKNPRTDQSIDLAEWSHVDLYDLLCALEFETDMSEADS